ncbi:MAG TPA: nuclear transport factor 2 family protein [Ramlibacter sp.]|nr:nuclear transport factor 2 family protein [Ramlibacter sp.]
MDNLAHLMIEHACQKLVFEAAARADANDAAGLAALFAQDAVLVRPDSQLLTGREAIQAAYAARPAGRITRHLVTNVRVEVASPTAASAVSYVLLAAGSESDASGPQGRPMPRLVVGEFHDRFSLIDGDWRIARREARFLLHTGD